MLITKLKDRQELEALAPGKVFLLCCRGCAELSFPEREAEELAEELLAQDRLAGTLTTDYICDPDNLALRLERRKAMLQEADAVLVLSCGVGVQTAAEQLAGKSVYAGCDTLRLPGFQGVTPLEHDCAQCGECWLNLTGGICPLTACSKGLVNGQCGGARNGKCEVDPGMDCGWERIHRRLEALGRPDGSGGPVRIRDHRAGKRRPDDNT